MLTPNEAADVDPVELEERASIVEEPANDTALSTARWWRALRSLAESAGPDVQRVKNARDILRAIETTAVPRSPFGWVSARGMFFDPLPSTKWIVRGLQICPGRPSMLAAYGSSGKTLAVQSLALACATGRNVWDGFRVDRPLVVRHLDHEQGRYATLRRYRRLAIGHGITAEELRELEAERRLDVAILPAVYLNQPGAEDVYCREFEGVDLVVLDALRGALPGCDENDSVIREHLDRFTRVSERIGTAFLFVHHAGKPKDGHSDARTVPRGSSAIFDASGSVFVMVGEKGEPKLMRHEKSAAEAEGGNVEDFYLAIEDVAQDDNPTAGVRVRYRTEQQVNPPTTPEERLQGVTREVLSVLQKNPGCGLRKLRELVGHKGTTVDAALEELETRGSVRRERRERGGFALFVDGETRQRRWGPAPGAPDDV